jgi:hypothetical protein
MILSGYTDSKLAQVKTYDVNQLYQVGYKGVTQITYGVNGEINEVTYEINGIIYITKIGRNLNLGSNVFATPTRYYFESDGLTQETINVIKKEVEMSISEPPKIEEEIFIERQETSVFERHLRMGEIKTIEQLEEYKNGYYNIFKLT